MRTNKLFSVVTGLAGVVVGSVGAISADRLLEPPPVTLRKLELIRPTETQPGLTKEQVDAVMGVEGVITSSGVGGDAFVWKNPDGSSLMVGWGPKEAGRPPDQLLQTPNRLPK